MIQQINDEMIETFRENIEILREKETYHGQSVFLQLFQVVNVPVVVP